MTLSKEAIGELLARGAIQAPFNTPKGGQAYVLPEGYVLRELAPIEEPLTRIEQNVILHDADSFIAYVNRFKTNPTTIFAAPGFLNNGVPVISAALDYHDPDKPDYVVHTATYAPRYSDQWKRWKEACAQPWKQAEFAEFLEEVRADIREPEAATILDIVRTFKASKGVDFDSVTPQADGTQMLHYSEKVTQHGKTASGKMPETITLGIPVYFRDALYRLPVFVRFRLSGGAVTFQLKIDRPDVVEDDAFKALVEKVAEATEIDVLLGKRA